MSGTKVKGLDLWAFWASYPGTGYTSYVGGPISEFLEDGKVRSSHFPGFVFTPAKILLPEEGKRIKEKLRALEIEYALERRKANEEFERKLAALVLGDGK